MKDQDRKPIERAVSDVLRNCSVRKNSLAPAKSEEEFKKLQSVLDKYFGRMAAPMSMANIVCQRLHKTVCSEVDIFPDQSSVTDVLTPEAIRKCAASVVDWLASLPRQYTFYIPAPILANYHRGQIELSDDMGFYEWRPDDSITVYGCRYIGGDRFDDSNDLTHTIGDNAAYIYVRARGFFDGLEYFGSFADAMSKIKQFSFLAMRKSNYYDAFWPLEDRVQTGFVVDDERGLDQAAAFVVPPTISKFLDTFGLEPWYDTEDSDFLDARDLSTLLRGDLDIPFRLLSEPDDFEAILTACEWAFDSRFESNDTISYIFLSIAFESLLNSAGGRGSITNTLAKQLATIAASYKDRPAVQKQFKTFYETRSDVAHGKRSKLDSKERELLQWGRDYFLKALESEVSKAVKPD